MAESTPFAGWKPFVHDHPLFSLLGQFVSPKGFEHAESIVIRGFSQMKLPFPAYSSLPWHILWQRTVPFNPDIFQLRQSNRFAVYQPSRAPLIVRRLGLFIMMLALELRNIHPQISQVGPRRRKTGR